MTSFKTHLMALVLVMPLSLVAAATPSFASNVDVDVTNFGDGRIEVNVSVIKDQFQNIPRNSTLYTALQPNKISEISERAFYAAGAMNYQSVEHAISELDRLNSAVSIYMGQLAPLVSHIRASMQAYGEFDQKALRQYSATSYSMAKSLGQAGGILALLDQEISNGRLVLTESQLGFGRNTHAWLSGMQDIWLGMNTDIVTISGF
ncbi:MAG: hypothetical protein ACSHWZ_19225 [Sulfitobacter sp.]